MEAAIQEEDDHMGVYGIEVPGTWRSVPGRISSHAQANPDAIAVRARDGALSFAELQIRIDMLARRLDHEIIGGDQVIALCLERTCDLPAWVVAILKVGAAYLPIDPTLPQARISQMLVSGRPAFILVSASLKHCLPETPIPVLSAEEEGAVQFLGRFDDRSQPNKLAYVMYTSGSTGVPKGVEIEQGSITTLIDGCGDFSTLAPGKSLLSLTRLSFDMSVFELFVPLCTGACLILSDGDHGADPHALAAAIEHHRPDVLQATPATWRLLLATGWMAHRPERILCGGEAMSRDLADQLIGRCGQLWNLYGPTEATVWSTASHVMPGAEPISVGHALPGWGVCILDPAGSEQPCGEVGEIAIYGPALARGYRGMPELTKDRFCELADGTRAYRTGDLGRSDGTDAIFCLGRLDHQVKIRGYRIELGDVECALDSHPGITWSAAKAWPDASGENVLAGYYVASPPDLASSDVRQFLAAQLPPFMLPDRLIALAAMPLNANGKVDRAALANPLAKSETSLENRLFAIADAASIESRLAAIWCELLHIDNVRADDDFFELGGYSLMTVQLLCAIEDDFDCHLAVTDLLDSSTLHAMALRIGRRETSSAVMLLNQGSARAPLYWVDAGPLIRGVAREMNHQPLYALNLTAQDEEALKEEPLDVKMVAAKLRHHLVQAQPQGPYYIGGWCRWAIVAHELACQLVDLGQDVKLLVNLAGDVPARRRRLTLYIPDIIKRRVGQNPGFNQSGLARMFRRPQRATPAKAPQIERPGMSQRVLNETRGFQPHVFTGDMLLIEPLAEKSSARHAWRGIVDGALTVKRVPGSHISMVTGPEASILASTIENALWQAQSPVLSEPEKRPGESTPPVRSTARLSGALF